MLSTDLSTCDCDGYVVVALRGELDLADAAEVGAVLGAVAARGPQIIVDLAGLEFIDSSGVAALARGRKHARQAGGDLLLAAPQQRVMRILVITCLAGGFPVYDSVEEAAVNPRHRMPAAAPAPGTAVWLSAHPPSAAVAALSTSVLSHRVGVAGKCSDTSDDRCYPALSEDPRSLEWVRYARAQCLGCTVRDECLELALRYEALTGASHGVWGVPPQMSARRCSHGAAASVPQDDHERKPSQRIVTWSSRPDLSPTFLVPRVIAAHSRNLRLPGTAAFWQAGTSRVRQ